MKQDFITFLQNEKEACIKKEKQLIADERKDEANLCKVEANIYDVFATLYQVSCKQAAGNEEEAEKMFIAKAEAVPKNWHISYEKAKEHDDSAKILIEETKLKAVEKIMETYRKL